MKRTLIKETINKIGEEVLLFGWINSVRSHGKIIFLDLRDYSGIVQLVLNPKDLNLATDLKNESVIEVVGKINQRPESMVKSDIITGKIEIKITELKILSKARTVPFDVSTDGREINEELRMKYRYLDIRRKRMQRNLRTRSDLINFCRKFLLQMDFTEIETPILTKSTPEGARDYLVPSRNHPGNFYALPQSPQQYKQLLMVAGIEKYFQIARCFRDEDLRADRQAEFTQLDMEVSFMTEVEIMEMVEKMFFKLVTKFFPEKKIKEYPFPRIPHSQAIKKWNTDRPDLRSNKDELAFAFIVDFPMFEKHENGYRAEHHPFTLPKSENINEITSNPENILAHQYDLVLNGFEIGGGSVRNQNPKIFEAVFEVLGYSKKEVREKFGHLLSAFEYGAPPHAGIAFGVERFLMILLGEESIREVIAFPKTGDGRDLMMGAPSDDLEKNQLDDLSIKVIKKNEKN